MNITITIILLTLKMYDPETGLITANIGMKAAAPIGALTLDRKLIITATHGTTAGLLGDITVLGDTILIGAADGILVFRGVGDLPGIIPIGDIRTMDLDILLIIGAVLTRTGAGILRIITGTDHLILT